MWVLFALLAAVAAAIVTTLSKAGLEKVDSNLAFAIQAVLIITVSWGVVLFNGNSAEVKSIDGRTWIFLITAGIFTALSSLLTFKALKLGEASQVNPLERISLVFAVLFAAWFLKEKITWQVIAGAALMLIGAVMIAMAKKT